MKPEKSLDLVQAVFIQLAERNSIPTDELLTSPKEDGDWNLGYRRSLQQEVASAT